MANNDVLKEDLEFFDKIAKLDPLFFCRGYTQEEMDRILKENGVTGDRNGKS